MIYLEIEEAIIDSNILSLFERFGFNHKKNLNKNEFNKTKFVLGISETTSQSYSLSIEESTSWKYLKNPLNNLRPCVTKTKKLDTIQDKYIKLTISHTHRLTNRMHTQLRTSHINGPYPSIRTNNRPNSRPTCTIISHLKNVRQYLFIE